MTCNFDAIINRRDSDSVKWNQFASDVLPLWVADMDFPAPPPVIDALRDRIDHGLFGYSFPQDSTKLSICSWLERRHNWQVSPEEVILFPGVVPAFNLVARACTNPGDSVLIQTPAYHPFIELPANVKLEKSEHSLQQGKNGNYEINLSEFKKKILPSTRVFMLCNPHNPTGRVFRAEELISLAEACLERNVIICSDEIHSDLVFQQNRHIPIASISEEISQSTVTLISPSKSFNLAGLKSSAAIIKNKRLRESFQDHSRGYAGSVNILGEAAMRAAYDHCEKWLEALLNYLENNRRILFDFVQNELPGVTMNMPEGTYLGWLDFSNTDIEHPGDFFLDKARVAMNTGDWFGKNYAQFARINFGCPTTTLTNALERIKSALIST
jgi:cystathionine beta-lyase